MQLLLFSLPSPCPSSIAPNNMHLGHALYNITNQASRAWRMREPKLYELVMASKGWSHAGEFEASADLNSGATHYILVDG